MSRWKVSETQVNTSGLAYRMVSRLGLRPQEDFVVLCLNAQNQVIGKPVHVARGSVDHVEVHPRDVFREAIHRNAASVLLAHNHPSGELSPSANDKMLTRRLVEAGGILGIPVLDHIIVGRGEYVSLADRGEMS